MFRYAWWGLYLLVCFLVPTDRIARGRIFSRWLRRLLRIRSVSLFRFAQIVAAGEIPHLVLSGAPSLAISSRSWTCIIALFLDDWLTGDDDDPWWKRAWGKVKLKMPAPVRLRPVERPTACIESTIQ